jgi:hypothetical protein
MKIRFFENWDKKLLFVLYRFPIPVIIAIVYACLSVWSIHSKEFELGDNFIAFFVTGFFLCVATTLSLEDVTKKWITQLLAGLISGLWLLFWCFQPAKFEGDYLFYLSAMSAIAFILAIFFGSYTKKGSAIPFWNFTTDTIIKAVISTIFAGVLMGGISLAFTAIDILFKAKLSHHIYLYLAIVCFFLFWPIYFLANIPSGEEKQDNTARFNKFLKIFSLYIVLPILLIYTSILYAYLFKIIFEWQLPNGWVSWLVSALGVGGIMATILMHPIYLEHKSKSGDLFCRYFPMVILPLLVLMTIGIFRRFNDYGLTINRLLVIIFNFWMYGIAIYLIFTRSKGIRMIFISFALIAFLAAIGPWNIFSITRQSVFGKIEETLTKNHILTNGKIDFSKQSASRLDSVTYANLESALRYMNSNFGINSIQPLFKDTLSKSHFYILIDDIKSVYSSVANDTETELNINPQPMPTTTDNFPYAIEINFGFNSTVNSTDNKTALSLNDNTLTLLKEQQPYITIPLSKEITRLKTLHTQHRISSTEVTTIKGDGFKLVISHLNVDLTHRPRITELCGILFYK